MSIIFEVIDLNCQALDNSFFVPNVQLTGKSTTSYATLYGYSEFVNPSTPPKKYRKATVTGFSKRVGFTAEQTPRQCAGGKYIWGGVGEVDFKGNPIQKYTKNFYTECTKQFWPKEGLISLPGAINTSAINPEFVAFCWSDWSSSCSSCDHNENNWPFIANQATGSLAFDLTGFYTLANDVVATKTTWSVNVVHNEITQILTGQPFNWELFGTSLDNYPVAVGSTTYDGRALITDPSSLVFPGVGLSDDGVNFHIGQYINFTDTSNHSAVLSEEYTDADALAHATIITGTGKTAQNTPRTTGFTSITTSVVYTLAFDNLITGEDYIATVDLWDLSEDNFGVVSVHTPKTYNFTANGATHTLVDVVPTPAPFHTITVQTPTVAFST